jgi:hypothetical protein
MPMTFAAQTTAFAADDVRVAGLPFGTRVMTLDGELPVEHLVPGDRVVSRTSGMAVLRAVKVEEVRTPMVRILAGSLGHTRPDRDMLVAPDTLVHIRDWRAQALYGAAAAMVPAARLVDGEFVAETEVVTARIVTLTFDRAQVIYADGLEVGC